MDSNGPAVLDNVEQMWNPFGSAELLLLTAYIFSATT